MIEISPVKVFVAPVKSDDNNEDDLDPVRSNSNLIGPVITLEDEPVTTLLYNPANSLTTLDGAVIYCRIFQLGASRHTISLTTQHNQVPTTSTLDSLSISSSYILSDYGNIVDKGGTCVTISNGALGNVVFSFGDKVVSSVVLHKMVQRHCILQTYILWYSPIVWSLCYCRICFC